MPSPSYTYTLTNGTTADASQVMQNFTDILNGATDGTKDFSISALTCAGTATLNGNVNIGNASGDDLTITASLASSIPIKTTNSFDIGSSTLGLRALYWGANSHTTKIQGSSSMAADWTLTLPTNVPTVSGQLLSCTTGGVSSWISSPKGITDGSSAASDEIGYTIISKANNQTVGTAGQINVAANAALTAGRWKLTAAIFFTRNGSWSGLHSMGISTATSAYTGTEEGYTLFGEDIGVINSLNSISLCVPHYDISISTAATYYLNYRADYATTADTYGYSLVAERK